ncbi:MAG TPA: class I SAM-dependent methyltransferase [Burkholderiales bacterium]|jgi:SAM-dependent methyltransferase
MLVALRPPVRFAFAKSKREFGFLERRFTPRTVFMEIGGADCSFAVRAAGYVERVYAIDVSGRFLQSVAAPLNLKLVLCDGVRIPVPEAAVDIAWSGAFMDHLHPDDATGHLRNVRRALADGGEYLCETASPQETRRRMLAAGFCAVRMPLLSRFMKSARIAAIK